MDFQTPDHRAVPIRDILRQLFRQSANPQPGVGTPTGAAPVDPNMPGDPSGPQRFAARAGLMNDTDRAAYETTQLPEQMSGQPTPQQLEQMVAPMPPPMRHQMAQASGAPGPVGMPVTEGANANIGDDVRQRALMWALRQNRPDQIDPELYGQ